MRRLPRLALVLPAILLLLVFLVLPYAEMIAMSGRKQKAAQVFDAIAWCRRLGLSVSVDLIFGWPRQTTTGMLRDLESVVEAGVDHLTHYELNVGGRTDFAVNRRRADRMTRAVNEPVAEALRGDVIANDAVHFPALNRAPLAPSR